MALVTPASSFLGVPGVLGIPCPGTPLFSVGFGVSRPEPLTDSQGVPGVPGKGVAAYEAAKAASALLGTVSPHNGAGHDVSPNLAFTRDRNQRRTVPIIAADKQAEF